jgi:hypothetical protein
LRKYSIYKVWSINPRLKIKEVNMPKEEITEKIKELMYKPDHIRNIGTVAHIDIL